MVPILSIASAKGGVGKTTLAVGLGTDLALEGYRVTLFDCDNNQHATTFARKATVSTFEVISDVNEENLLGQIKKASATADLIILDLPGVTSRLVMMGLAKSTFVLIPCQPSLLDVRDAIRTEQQVSDAAELSGRDIGRAIIWTRVSSGFETRVSKAVRETLNGRNLPLLSTVLLERTAFREMFLTGQPPRGLDSMEKPSQAATNLRTIGVEVLERLHAKNRVETLNGQ
ncbi:MAG: ParA family protein [Candidatus Competibacter denitrificans]